MRETLYLETHQATSGKQWPVELLCRSAQLALAIGIGAATALAHASEPIDVLRFGDASSEAAHGLAAQASKTGVGALGQPFRRFLPLAPGDWRGGQASFRLKVSKDGPNY